MKEGNNHFSKILPYSYCFRKTKTTINLKSHNFLPVPYVCSPSQLLAELQLHTSYRRLSQQHKRQLVIEHLPSAAQAGDKPVYLLPQPATAQ